MEEVAAAAAGEEAEAGDDWAVNPAKIPVVQKGYVPFEGVSDRQCGPPSGTPKGTVLAKTAEEAYYLTGGIRGIDDQGIRVSYRYSGDSVVGQEVPKASEEMMAKKKSHELIPGRGFRLFEGQDGEVYFRLFTYAR